MHSFGGGVCNELCNNEHAQVACVTLQNGRDCLAQTNGTGSHGIPTLGLGLQGSMCVNMPVRMVRRGCCPPWLPVPVPNRDFSKVSRGIAMTPLWTGRTRIHPKVCSRKRGSRNEHENDVFLRCSTLFLVTSVRFFKGPKGVSLVVFRLWWFHRLVSGKTRSNRSNSSPTIQEPWPLGSVLRTMGT